ncbi:NlpC/P60 family [Acididesulfobacillus acetoxydans]|uniref:NlpC/P60 family n=1 Tax=Acididesulfobacillus acetoxydans TaxID=1561005 RepID=A0A8S0W3F5_9FIRM|nr:NlpC/P60 family protein [Acididesulfobacillus acetoxydans]CAA7601618.1 NlpC/P60 family [Acididesulfobacillus acetoxydans]CEJ07105.1 NlpC/P60 protein [Acididesulfobacillus acetoxydans]
MHLPKKTFSAQTLSAKNFLAKNVCAKTLPLKKTALLFCSALLTLSPAAANAATLQQQLHNYQAQVNQYNGQLSAQKQQETTATHKLLALRQSVQSLRTSIDRYQKDLAQRQQALTELTAQEAQLENERNRRAAELAGFVRDQYEAGPATYLNVLFQATSLSDFLDRWQTVQGIVHGYDALQQQVQALTQAVDQKKAAVQQEASSLRNELAAKQQTQSSLQAAVAQQQSVLDQLSAKEKTTVAAAADAQTHADNVQRLIREQELEAALAAAGRAAGINPTSGTGTSAPVKMSGNVQSLLGYAAQYLGTPYVWGGTSPHPGFDCSGFVQYVYAHFGVPLYRTSESQFTEGEPVALSNLQPGDLVFYRTYAPDASHVGIYVGNHTMIDSAAYGVAYDDMNNSYWTARYLGARRVITK